MPNFGYHLARAEGSAVRRFYSAALPIIARRKISKLNERLPFEVYSYSGEDSLPEQVASIRSFLRYAGQPQKWTVVSDGTHSARGRDLLQSIDPIVAVSSPNEWMPDAVPEKMCPYLRDHSTGRQLALIMSLPRNGPALYIDSDVLFFPNADEVKNLRETCYLRDCQLSADERLFRAPSEKNDPINTGVLFLREKLDWSLGIARFLELDGPPNFFTNQTITHLVLHEHGAAPFDPQRFVLQLDDQFVYPDKYAAPKIVLRHYVQPVRHKFWTTLGRG